jgi:ribosomal protein S11
MFEGCSNLENININWPNINSTIHNIEGMFQNCYRYNEKEKKEYGLETVEIIIKGIDVKQEKYLKSLKNLFSGCAKLKE